MKLIMEAKMDKYDLKTTLKGGKRKHPHTRQHCRTTQTALLINMMDKKNKETVNKSHSFVAYNLGCSAECFYFLSQMARIKGKGQAT